MSVVHSWFMPQVTLFVQGFLLIGRRSREEFGLSGGDLEYSPNTIWNNRQSLDGVWLWWSETWEGIQGFSSLDWTWGFEGARRWDLLSGAFMGSPKMLLPWDLGEYPKMILSGMSHNCNWHSEALNHRWQVRRQIVAESWGEERSKPLQEMFGLFEVNSSDFSDLPMPWWNNLTILSVSLSANSQYDHGSRLKTSFKK